VARTEIERTVLPSLIDRLTDLEPGRSADGQMTREQSAREFRVAVQRDVEWLLNTRRTIVEVPPTCPEVHASVHEFGLPDTTGIPVGTPEGRALLLEMLRDTLERFEPRLGNLNVKLADAQEVKVPQLKFTLEALLRMDPSPEHVVFDTVLEVARGEYEVQATDDA
jgi:type VI secretion system protein ImpF